MNPYQIYRDDWAKAVAIQATSATYTTFVAMPFQEQFSYRSKQILRKVIGKAVSEANRRATTPRKFEQPRRVELQGASIINDEIVRGILNSHIFLGDLTLGNPGVLLETGIALATKPPRQVILITQGSLDQLHFDVRNNGVICYSPNGALSKIADAFVGAALNCEEQVAHYIEKVERRLSPEAMFALHHYGMIQQENRFYSLHQGSRGKNFNGVDGSAKFDLATRELREKDLIWTDYRPQPRPDHDVFGMHATEFGWAVIGKIWPELRRELARGTIPGRQTDGAHGLDS